MLSKLITSNDIKLNLESTDRDECFAELLELIVAKQPDINRSEVLCALNRREEKGSTAIFPYVAVPHSVCKTVKKTSIVIGISKKGIEFDDCMDPSKSTMVNVIFEIVFEEKDTDLHLHVLRDVLQLVSNKDFVKKVLQAGTSAEVFKMIEELEK